MTTFGSTEARATRAAALDQTEAGGDPVKAVALAIVYLADNIAVAGTDTAEIVSAGLRYVGESIEAAAL